MDEIQSTETETERPSNNPSSASEATDNGASGAHEAVTESDDAELFAAEEAIEKDSKVKTVRASIREAYKQSVAKDKLVASVAEQGPAPKVINAPSSWSAEDKAEFAKLPTTIQERFARRATESERAISQKMQELGEHERYLSNLAEVAQTLEPYREQLDLDGISPAQAINQFFALQKLLDKDPEAGIREIARRYDLDLNSVVAPKQGQQQLHPALQQMVERQERLEAELRRRDEDHQQRVMGSYEQQVMEFAEATDEKGNPLHPHLENLIYDMQPIVGQLRAENKSRHPQEILKEAYDRALWSNPKTRESALKSQAMQEEAKRIAKENERAQAAKRASKSISGSSALAVAKKAPKSVRETIEAVMNGTLDS